MSTRECKVKFNQQEDEFFEGIFHANDRGFGFVVVDENEPNIFIPIDSSLFAMDKDKVKGKIVRQASHFGDRGAEGKILEILTHAVDQLVGVFEAHVIEKSEKNLYGVVRPKDKKLKDYLITISKKEGMQPESGSVVVVQITQYASLESPFLMRGIVSQIVGLSSDLGMDILETVYAHGIFPDFPEEVIKESKRISSEITEDNLSNRRDLRMQKIVTIDGEDAKDLDDAVCVWRKDNGNYHLGVHIADVSYYVTEGSSLDCEAYERATSIYLADRVIPMLPSRLSNEVCSLQCNVPRLTMSCEMEIDSKGEIISYELFPSVIKTSERMTYAVVNQILDGNKELQERYKECVPMFEKMAELHYLLEDKRKKRGAIQFEESKTKIRVNEKGYPLEPVLHERGLGERLIESFMLAANETVAKYFSDSHLPALYRVHEHPKADKLEKFLNFVSMFGIVLKGTSSNLDSSDLQKVLMKVNGKPEERIIQIMLLRSMQQARYSEHNYGHYGLAAENYTHFTSPIRRYPDLVVHRLINSYTKSVESNNKKRWREILPEIAAHTSARERRAVDVEREVEAMKKAEYLSEHIGEEFSGVICAVVKFGFFVELKNTIEGLVHVRTLTTDYFHFLERQLTLVGKRTGKIFKIGQKVVIRVTKADPKLREIDFELISSEEVEKNSVLKNSDVSKKPNKQINFTRNRKDRRRKKKSAKKSIEKEFGENYGKKRKKKAKIPFHKRISKGKKK